jgi:hypothetical protein
MQQTYSACRGDGQKIQASDKIVFYDSQLQEGGVKWLYIVKIVLEITSSKICLYENRFVYV